MIALTKYYLYFFLLCLVFTLISGVAAALLPNAIAGALTALPYMVAMICVLHIFLKQQQRAPTQSERKKFAVIFVLLFWLFNILGMLAGLWIFSLSDPGLWQDVSLYFYSWRFTLIILGMGLVISLPMFLLTYWFYGKQAQRMAEKMFEKNNQS